MRSAADLLAGLGPLAGRLRRLAGPLSLVAVIAAGLWLVWPLVLGDAPLSADHPVHLTRIWLFGQVLQGGQLRGWSDLWFFGMPVGELYPPLGDLIVVALRGLTLGLASWGACYAWMVAGVFTLQGVALWHAGRTLQRGALPGLCAGLLALVDAGAYREGGWTYTMLYGVWPQALQTSLALLCLSEAARARAAAAPERAQRHLAWAALAGGGALLAHPMGLPSLALAGGIAFWVLGRTGPGGPVGSDRSKEAGAASEGAPTLDLSQEAASEGAGPGPEGDRTPSSNLSQEAASEGAGPGPEGDRSPSSYLSQEAASGDAGSGPVGDRSPSSGLSQEAASEGAGPGREGARSPSSDLSQEAASGGAGPGREGDRSPSSDLSQEAASEDARPRLGAGAADLALIGGLALGVAAWWLLPMLAHRGWMASYGWLHAPLDLMTRMATEGRWTQHMPAAVGWAVWLGIAVTLIRGPALARLVGAWGLAQWLLASADAFWSLRLDHLSAGFAHVQFQRFLIAAKPGLFLLAGVGVAALPRALARVARSRLRAHLRWPLAMTLAGATIILVGGVIEGSRAAIRAHHVGEVQLARFPDRPARADDYARLLEWLRQREAAGEGGRVAFRAHRNAHWFMDSPLTTGARTYKVGFTPGDNFVHKPEAGGEALFDRLGVRFVVSLGGRRAGAAATFGDLVVQDRGPPGPPAHLEGPGSLEIVDGDPSDGEVVVRITGADPAATRLVLNVAGYPRWA
ncbi:MAG: hypothetical protein R3B09_28310, partial [Nannocystaceae bacterium]